MWQRRIAAALGIQPVQKTRPFGGLHFAPGVRTQFVLSIQTEIACAACGCLCCLWQKVVRDADCFSWPWELSASPAAPNSYLWTHFWARRWPENRGRFVATVFPCGVKGCALPRKAVLQPGKAAKIWR